MISPELLRRYPFFCCIDEESQRAVAMAADEMICESGAVLFEEGQTVESLYLLVDGVSTCLMRRVTPSTISC